MEKSASIKALNVVVPKGCSVSLTTTTDIVLKVHGQECVVSDHVIKFSLEEGSHDMISVVNKKVAEISSKDLMYIHAAQYMEKVFSAKNTDAQ